MKHLNKTILIVSLFCTLSAFTTNSWAVPIDWNKLIYKASTFADKFKQQNELTTAKYRKIYSGEEAGDPIQFEFSDGHKENFNIEQRRHWLRDNILFAADDTVLLYNSLNEDIFFLSFAYDNVFRNEFLGSFFLYIDITADIFIEFINIIIINCYFKEYPLTINEIKCLVALTSKIMDKISSEKKEDIRKVGKLLELMILLNSQLNNIGVQGDDEKIKQKLLERLNKLYRLVRSLLDAYMGIQQVISIYTATAPATNAPQAFPSTVTNNRETTTPNSITNTNPAAAQQHVTAASAVTTTEPAVSIATTSAITTTQTTGSYSVTNQTNPSITGAVLPLGTPTVYDCIMAFSQGSVSSKSKS